MVSKLFAPICKEEMADIDYYLKAILRR